MAAARSDDSLHDTIEQLEQSEARWQRVDASLRRLLGRLTYAAEGRTNTLDACLGDLRRHARDSLDEARIAKLTDELTQAVKSLDDAEPVTAAPPATAPAAPAATPAASPAPSLAQLLLAVIERLSLGEESSEELAALRQQISHSDDVDALHGCGMALAGLVSRRLQQLEDDRRRASELLAQVNGQLATLAEHLDQDDLAHRDVAAARRQLDERMQGEVRALGDSARNAPDLATLQNDVQARLQAVSNHLAALREREQAREAAWQERSERMRERIVQLESSTQRMEITLEQKIQLADTDALTNLPNRRALEARMASLCESGAEHTSLIVLDIDHFKAINDQLGHSAGDRALCIVAEQLQTALRPGDFLARYGGEEFVAVIPSGAAEAMQVAERLRAKIQAIRFHSQNQPVPITMSCGIATVREGDNPAKVFERADQALYQAKDSGRNRCIAL